MGKPQDNHNKIPLPLIVLGYLISPPVGVVLTILRVLIGSKGTGKRKTSSASSKQSGTGCGVLVMGILLASFILSILGAGATLLKGLASLNLHIFFEEYMAVFLVMLFLAVCCGVPLLYFKKKRDVRNVIRSIIGKRETLSLRQLASTAGLRPKKLRKELQAMINKGEFGEEAYIDLSSGRFMRHPDALEDMLRKEAEKAVDTESSSRPEEPVEEMEESEFRSIILQIRKLNDDIKDYDVSERIYRIEEHTQNIFDYVTAHPEAMPQIRKFMNYYLPTTLKLLDSYSRIEQVGVAGKNMQKSKENIEEILDTLVEGFQQQVDKLFANESMDISSEITVLEAMMKQDGLDGKSDFEPVETPSAPDIPAFTEGYTDDLSENGGAAQAKL